MLAQNSLFFPRRFPFFRGHARQRGRGFAALAQTHGELQSPLLKNM